MLLMVRMEPVDIFTAIVLVAMIGEAYVRIQSNKRADKVLEQGETLGRILEVPRNIDAELMSMPRPSNEWSPGLGSYLSARPMLIFFVIIIGLAGVMGTVGLVATVPKMILAVLAIVLGVAFHSGPNRYTLFEYFIQVATKREIETLSDQELGLLSQARDHMEVWAQLQAAFAVGLLLGVLLPIDLAAPYVLLLTFIIFLMLGFAYDIHKGIFAGPG